MIAGANRLKVIAMHGVGVDHIDRAAAQKKGVVVANAPGANSNSVADLAFGLMLAAFDESPSRRRPLPAVPGRRKWELSCGRRRSASSDSATSVGPWHVVPTVSKCAFSPMTRCCPRKHLQGPGPQRQS